MFAALFSRMGARARLRCETLPEMLERIGGELSGLRFLPDVLRAFRAGGDLQAAWEAALAEPALGSVLRPEEEEALLAFPAVLRNASAAAFEEACRNAAASFAAFAAAAGAERARQTRLWTGLGAFGALLTVIVLT